MESASSTNTGAAARLNNKFIAVGLIFFMSVLLSLSFLGLHSAYVSQKEILALQAQMDELIQTSAAFNQLLQEEMDAKNTEILALQAQMEELFQMSAALNEKALTERNTEIDALQMRIDELSRGVEVATIATGPDTTSLADMEIADEETPLVSLAESPSIIAQAGQTINVAVYAPEIKDMYGYELKVYYGPDEIKYSGDLESGISVIPTIFSKEFENYVLIGATMVGKKEGYTAKADKTEICAFSFTALKEVDLSALSLSAVNIVNSGREYKENIENWEITATVV